MMRSRPPAHVAVVGSGLAGLRTCAALREQGFSGRITVLGDEGIPAYDRPPLSKELLTRTEPLWLEGELGVTLADLAEEVLLDSPAASLTAGPDGIHRVHLGARSTGEANTGEANTGEANTGEARTIDADAVVLACGATPINPWPRALTLHSSTDAAALRERLTETTGAIVIIGAGWIGAEVAGVAAAAGWRATVVEAADQPLARQLPRDLAARTRSWYSGAGATLRTHTQVVDVTDDGVTTVGQPSPDRGDGGGEPDHIQADVVLAAVGVRPSTAWLQGAVELNATGHVLIDHDGRSSIPGIWAVGDCGWRTDDTYGDVPGGHWSAALHDPDLLAAAILDAEPPAVRQAPFIYSTQLGHQLTVFGRTDGELITRDYDGGGWTALAVEGDTLTGGVVADVPRDVSALRKLLRGALPRIDIASAADPGQPLRSLAR